MSEGSWILRYSSCPTLHGLEVSFRKTIWCPAPILKSTLKINALRSVEKQTFMKLILANDPKNSPTCNTFLGMTRQRQGKKVNPTYATILQTSLTSRLHGLWESIINPAQSSKLQLFYPLKNPLEIYGNILWMFYQGLLSTTQGNSKNNWLVVSNHLKNIE